MPELVRAIKDTVEEDRRPGRFLITGSANLLEIPGTEESLAGRAETVVLYGLSQGEIAGQREDFLGGPRCRYLTRAWWRGSKRHSRGDGAGGCQRRLRRFVRGVRVRRAPAPAGLADTQARIFHFRDRNGLEADIVLESPDQRVAGLEMKAAGGVSESDFKGLSFLRDKLKDRFKMGVVLYTGTRALPFGDRLWALPYSALWT